MAGNFVAQLKMGETKLRLWPNKVGLTSLPIVTLLPSQGKLKLKLKMGETKL